MPTVKEKHKKSKNENYPITAIVMDKKDEASIFFNEEKQANGFKNILNSFIRGSKLEGGENKVNLAVSNVSFDDKNKKSFFILSGEVHKAFDLIKKEAMSIHTYDEIIKIIKKLETNPTQNSPQAEEKENSVEDKYQQIKKIIDSANPQEQATLKGLILKHFYNIPAPTSLSNEKLFNKKI